MLRRSSREFLLRTSLRSAALKRSQAIICWRCQVKGNPISSLVGKRPDRQQPGSRRLHFPPAGRTRQRARCVGAWVCGICFDLTMFGTQLLGTKDRRHCSLPWYRLFLVVARALHWAASAPACGQRETPRCPPRKCARPCSDEVARRLASLFKRGQRRSQTCL